LSYKSKANTTKEELPSKASLLFEPFPPLRRFEKQLPPDCFRRRFRSIGIDELPGLVVFGGPFVLLLMELQTMLEVAYVAIVMPA